MTKQYYRDANAIVLVYDITTSESFLNLPHWLKLVKESAKDDVKLLLVGNKKDRADKVISKELGSKFAEKYDMQFVETSAANEPASIDALFRDLAKELKENGNYATDTTPSTADNKTNNTREKKRRRC